jgi:glycosyltransferase involved in cell wall biosynthesis
MDSFLLYLGIATLLFWVAIGIELGLGNRSIRFLRDLPLPAEPPSRRVSIIIPARNEERNIEEALQSVLRLEYGNREIIVVNDRSTDRTGAILGRIARAYPALRVVHLTELPPGWLGKNHALHCGAQQASGDLLLFTDADVVMQPSGVSRAVGYMVEHRLDHLAIAPDVRMPGVLLELFVGAFGIFFSLYARPWRAKDPKSKRYIGIGAFNLVRRDVYQAVGGHQAIAMRPDDDIKLGKLIKKHAYRQEFLFGTQMMHVEWYASLGELIDGLMKNAFAGVEYNVSAIIGVSLAQFLLNVWPVFGILFTHGATRVINVFVVLVIIAVCADTAKFHDVIRWFGIGFPIATLLFIYIMWRAMLTAIFNQSVHWRGTRYSLTEMKANKV